MHKAEKGRSTRFIDPTSPYDFELSSQIFSNGDPHITKFQNGAYRQVVRASNRMMLATVTSKGSVEKPQLQVTLASDRSLSDHDVLEACEVISKMLNVRLDVTEFYKAIHDDPVSFALTTKLRGLKNPITATVFEALFDSIVEQQISLAVAHILQRRVIASFGDVLLVDGFQYHAFPTPEQIALSSLGSLRRCGLSLRKAEYVKEIAHRIAAREVDLEKLRQCSNVQELIDHLRALRGVGLWTAELTALRGLNRLDIIPSDDLGLRRAIGYYYCQSRSITSAQARSIAQRWGKWKGLAGYYLIIAERLKIPSSAKI